ncbi:MAG: hypothetical protein IT205_01740 [Fimbriimonadaceae bacterium]|nr:hypothetical protein [Fimbriimonadaceae bacterium]
MNRTSLIALAVQATCIAQAGTLVVPPAHEFASGGATFLGPLANAPRTYQLLIHENQLTNVVGKTLNGITFRLVTSATAAFPLSDITFDDYSITLGPGLDPVSRTGIFATNFTGLPVQVRTGPLTIPAGSFPPDDHEFGPSIPFSGYTYAGGHLVVEIRKSGFSGTSASVDAISSLSGGPLGYGTNFAASWSSDPLASSGSTLASFSILKFSYEEPATMPISGTIVFGDYIGSLNGKAVQMTLTNAGATASVHSGVVTVNASGAYVFSVPLGLPTGNYDLYANASPFLRRKASIQLAGVGATNVDYVLQNGDCDDSGEVDAADIDAVIAVFGLTEPDPGYSLSTDVDGSQEVDAADIDIVIANFGGTDE